MKTKNKKSKVNSSLKAVVKAMPVLFTVAFIVFGSLYLKDIEVSTVLPIKEVSVNGDLTFLDKGEIKSIVENNISGGFFTVDLNLVRELLIAKPWVENISLRRQWPDLVDVVVEEHTAIAYWNNDGYISANGDVFKPEIIDKSLNIPALDGPEGQHNNVWKFMNVLYKEMSLLHYDVTKLTLDERRAWQLKIIDNSGIDNESNAAAINIRLGRFDTEKRMQRLIQMLPTLTTKKEFSKNNIKVIDMRYPNGFSVRTMTDEA